MQRYFALDKNLNLTSKDIFHIKKVMRMKVNDFIEIVYDEKVYLCKILSLDGNDIKFNVEEELDTNNELSKKITIVFSIVNETKTDFILQKCTELGAYDFIPYASSRSKTKIEKKEDKKIERWNMITKEAAEQSYRNISPKVYNVKTLSEICNLDYDLKIVLSTKENEKSIKNVMQNNNNCDRIIIVVGPEGGLDTNEEKKLKENGFILTSLGKTILRTETAPIFVMSALKYELMR